MAWRLVFDRILRRIRELVGSEEYVVTVHAVEELDADGFDLLDLETCILTGEIAERLKDRTTGEWKYVVHGASARGRDLAAVVKLASTNKVVVVTVFAL